MPRFTGKTYGRKPKSTDSNKTFDDIINEGKLSTSKASSTIRKWGSTSFTSTRGGSGGVVEEECVRKRKLDDVDPESMFDDPFSFDSDDDGPSRPKRGMGFKVGDQKKVTKHKSHGSKTRKDENNDEKDTMKQAPTKTYSRGSRLGKSEVKKCLNAKHQSKQLSMDKFATKLSSSNDQNRVFHLTLKGSSRNKQAGSSSPPQPKKFFTSSSQASKDSNPATGMSDKLSATSDKGSELFESASEFEYDSEELANLESGDPEIIFNSPQRRRREEEQRIRSSLDGLDNYESSEDVAHARRNLGEFGGSASPDCDDLLDKTITNSNEWTQAAKPEKDFSHLFSVTEKQLGKSQKEEVCSSTESPDPQVSHSGILAGQQSYSSSDNDDDESSSVQPKNDFSHLFSETEKRIKSKTDKKDETLKTDGRDSDRQSGYGKKSKTGSKVEEKSTESLQSSKNLSHLFKDTEKQLQREREVCVHSGSDGEVEPESTCRNSGMEKVRNGSYSRTNSRLKPDISNIFSQTENRLGGISKRRVFSDSEGSDKGDDSDDELAVSKSSIAADVWQQKTEMESAKGKTKAQAPKNKVKTNNKKRAGKSTRLFADSDHDSDTDDLSSLQKSPVRMLKGCSSSNILKSASFGDKPLSELLPGFRRSGSVESNSSNGSGDRLKRSSSLMTRIQSMDVEKDAKKSKQPIVRRLLTSPKKEGKRFKASYNPHQWREDDSGQNTLGAAGTSTVDADTGVKVNRQPHLRHVTKAPSNPYDDEVSALKVHKEHKELFTVVTHVKPSHECLEYGETQDFNDELDYIMDGLGQQQPLPVRCLSCLNLATKCTLPSFRMHLRAHGTLDKVFSTLCDAYQSPPLALVSAAVLYLVTRDRFSMDLEQSTLTLMLMLLSVDSEEQSPSKNNSLNREYVQQQEKIRQLFNSCKKERDGGRTTASKVDPETITTGHLTMESLLSLTSKKAGDWFKEELRTLGGLDHIIKTVNDCTEDLSEAMIEPDESSLDQLSKVERCLRVLENVTYMNPENQNYLVSHKSCLLVSSLFRTLRIGETCLTFNNLEEVGGKVNKECAGYIVFNTLLAVIKVLLNITHDNNYTSTKVGQQAGLIKKVLFCLLRLPQYIPCEQGFDLLVLGLGLLINMVEHCEHNRDILISSSAVCPFDETSPISKLGGSMSSLEALTKLFVLRYEAAKRIEVEHDAELDERQRLQQERTERAGMVNAIEDGSSASGGLGGAAAGGGNKSGEWKHSASGLEWVVLEEDEEEKVEREIEEATAGDSDSEMDVEVVQTNVAQDEEEHFTKALHRAGRHMEDCILAAYVALLLGCTIQGNMDHIDRVRDCLPEGDFEPMVRMLKKFLGFMNFTATSTVSQSSGSKSITRIIEVLEAC